MKNWYLRHQRGAYYLWMGIGFAALIGAEFLMLARTGDVNTPALLIPFALWIYLGLFIFQGGPLRRNRKAVAALNNDCDPVPLLNWADTELAYWSAHRARKSYLTLCAMNRAVALHALGRDQEAEAAAPDQKNLTDRGAVKLVYFLNMAIIQLGLDRPLVAGQYARQAEKLMAERRLNKARSDQYAFSLENIQCTLLLKDKKTAGLEERFQSLLTRATTEYQRVCVHYDLAELAIREGRPADARPHLEYVIAHGNKLGVVDEAQTVLEALKG